jgi:acyl-CoA synthetase (AMP-forming)/AMP-acid ligase II
MIQDLLSETASKYPKQPALICGDVETTYAELKEMTDLVSDHLRESGIRKGDRVVLLFDNGPAYAALFFGVLNAGGVVVPLNPSSVEENIRYVARHCSAKFMAVTERAASSVVKWWDGPPLLTDSVTPDGCLSLSGVFGMLRTGAHGTLHCDRGDLAVVLYTSGTTGPPKGVMLSHRNLEANTRSILGYLPLRYSDRTLAVLPFYYSYGNSLLLTHVSVGGTLVVENGFAFVRKAIETMRRQRVTGFSGVPSHYAILINRSGFLDEEWPALRYMTCAGGGLPVSHTTRLRQALPGVSLHLMYGQTEACARLSSLQPDMVDERPDSIGRGIQNVKLRVVNEAGEDVPEGEVGEIIARGPNIMLGYLGDPEATKNVLREDWLYTGDLATIREGYLYIAGRSKEIIKCGGYRISPHQIENVILEHPSVQECAVVGMDDEIQGEKIVGFVVCREDPLCSNDMESIISFLRERLPHYMVPARIEQLRSLPKTDSGKIKRAELSQRSQGFPKYRGGAGSVR